MKCPHAVSVSAFLLLVGVVLLDAVKANESPLNECTQLLDSLAAKITKEGEAEAKAYRDFVEWCDDAAANTKYEIKTATSKKEKLEAAIAKSTSDAGASGAKIEELAASVASADADLKSATTVREKEKTDFDANDAELTDVIDTLSRALTVIEREMAKNPAAFAQMDTSSIGGLVKALSAIVDAAAFSGDDKKRLVALVQSQEHASSEEEESCSRRGGGASAFPHC